MPCGPDVRLRELAVLTEGYTGADIKLVCREAAISALEVIVDYCFNVVHHSCCAHVCLWIMISVFSYRPTQLLCSKYPFSLPTYCCLASSILID